MKSEAPILPEIENLEWMLDQRDAEMLEIMANHKAGRDVILNISRKVDFRERMQSVSKHLMTLGAAVTALGGAGATAEMLSSTAGFSAASPGLLGVMSLGAAAVTLGNLIKSTCAKKNSETSLSGELGTAMALAGDRLQRKVQPRAARKFSSQVKNSTFGGKSLVHAVELFGRLLDRAGSRPVSQKTRQNKAAQSGGVR